MTSTRRQQQRRVSITGDDETVGGYLQEFRKVYQPKLYRKSTLEWKESVACYYWHHDLKRLWKCYNAKHNNFGFVPPVAYYRVETMSDVKKRGTEGEHFAEGYESLYHLLEKYGVFEEPEMDEEVSSTGLPLLVDYKGPPLPSLPPTVGSVARSVSVSPEARPQVSDGNAPPQDAPQVLNGNDVHRDPIANRTILTTSHPNIDASSKRPREDDASDQEQSSASAKTPRVLLATTDAVPTQHLTPPFRLSRLEEEVFGETKAGILYDRLCNLEKYVFGETKPGIPVLGDRLCNLEKYVGIQSD